jgi:hypothetical protein
MGELELDLLRRGLTGTTSHKYDEYDREQGNNGPKDTLHSQVSFYQDASRRHDISAVIRCQAI